MTNNANSNKPTHFAYITENYEKDGEQKTSWNKIGSAWAHQDSEGFSIILKSIPVDGKITVRIAKEKDENIES